MTDWTPSKWFKQTFPDFQVEEKDVDWAEVSLIVDMAEAFDAKVEGMPLEVWLATLPPTQTVLH